MDQKGVTTTTTNAMNTKKDIVGMVQIGTIGSERGVKGRAVCAVGNSNLK